MPPKANTNSSSKAGKVFSADTVAAVLMATGTVSLGMKHYEVMSALDGVKSASAFQHDFRSVLAKAKELKARSDEGEIFEPVKPGTKRGTYYCVGFLAAPSPLLLPCCRSPPSLAAPS